MRSSLGRPSSVLSIRARAITVAALFAIAAGTLSLWKIGTAAGAQVTDEILSNPAISGEPVLIGKRHIATSGSRSVILYQDMYGHPWTYIRDQASGQSTHVRLPEAAGETWSAPTYTLRTSNELWVLAGTGPLQLRQYQFNGSTLPTGATLLSTRTFGDSDSRPDDLIALQSGAMTAVSHQQGNAGPQGIWISYWSPSTSAWSTLPSLDFMPTRASKFVAVQHPADGSVWVFGNPDSWGALGAIRLSEASNQLHVDWTNSTFISSSDGNFNVDPENPDIEASVDPAAGKIVLTYQSTIRQIYSTSPVVTGSYPVLAQIGANGSKAFVSMDTYVERVSSLGLSVNAGDTWIAYRPIQSDLSFSTLDLRRRTTAGWDAPIELGRLYSPYQQVMSDAGATEFLTRLADGKIHLFRAGASGGSPSPSPSPTATSTSSPSPSPTPTSTPVAKCKPTKTQKCR
jgi:hypothetical protein